MKFFYRGYLALFLLLPLFFSSCSVINPAEEIPSYIHIDSISLSTNNAQHGSNSHKITDAWVYVNDQLIGAFELPANIPVLEEGVKEVKVRAGIKVNGISATRSRYPFYNLYEETVNLVTGQAITVNPTVTYFASFVPFELIEGFENAGVSFTDTLNSDTTLVILNSPDPNVFEGNRSGAVYLDDAHPRFLGISAGTFSIPTNGADAFLELNYKCNQHFSLGIIGGTIDYREAIVLNPTSGWNKIYIRLSELASLGPVYGSYRLYFAMQKESSVSLSELYLDNIKLIY